MGRQTSSVVGFPIAESLPAAIDPLDFYSRSKLLIPSFALATEAEANTIAALRTGAAEQLTREYGEGNWSVSLYGVQRPNHSRAMWVPARDRGEQPVSLMNLWAGIFLQDRSLLWIHSKINSYVYRRFPTAVNC